MSYRLFVGTLMLLAASTFGCSDPTSPSTGHVNVMLTDAPLDLSTVHAVNVTLDGAILFERTEMESDDEGYAMDKPGVSAGQGLTVNLLDYQDGQVLIGKLDVPPGNYNKIRLYVSAAELVMEDPTDPTMELKQVVDVPSGKVDVPVMFPVTAGDTTEVTLDFDVPSSVQVNETSGSNKEYILRPVITPVGVAHH